MVKIVVIDGQGGGIGKTLVEKLRVLGENTEIIAVGTNALATSAMLKAGASAVATGESAVVFNCRTADFICGPMGIAFAYSMLGEISPVMAQAVSTANAEKILIPINKCKYHIVGVAEKPLLQYIDEVVSIIRNMLQNNE